MNRLYPKKGAVRVKEYFHRQLLFVFCLFAFTLLASCGGNNGRFKLEGQFKNMNQAELYLYDIESGQKDTIKVLDGSFTLDKEMKDTTTLILLFPNYSELPILARPGAKVKVKGDVSHLKETEISGNKENEELTAFRKKTNAMLPQQARNEARKFITEHSKSLACHYLLRRYFILSTEPDYKEALRLCGIVLKAQPGDRHLLRLRHQLEQLAKAETTALPDFSVIDSKGDTITNAHLHAQANVIQVWAHWDYGSQNTLSLLRRLQKQHHDSIAVVSVSLDATPAEGRYELQRDSINWPNICDGKMWDSPLIRLLGVTSVPANVVADSTGHIVGRNMSNADLEKTIKELLNK